jgi:hypothetical protein
MDSKDGLGKTDSDKRTWTRAWTARRDQAGVGGGLGQMDSDGQVPVRVGRWAGPCGPGPGSGGLRGPRARCGALLASAVARVAAASVRIAAESVRIRAAGCQDGGCLWCLHGSGPSLSLRARRLSGERSRAGRAWWPDWPWPALPMPRPLQSAIRPSLLLAVRSSTPSFHPSILPSFLPFFPRYRTIYTRYRT